jgi:hypothetical protein
MHTWGDEDVDWEGINDAAYYIAHWLKTWARLGVLDYKEKFGTVRVYCSFGFHSFYSIWRPSHCWISKRWPYKLDLWIASETPIMDWINAVVIPIQMKAYAWRYKKAVQKWPHLYKEIVSQADHGELFEGVVPGYKHSDYWREV